MIPKQLRNEKFKFILVGKESKKPLEVGWTRKNSKSQYNYYDERLKQHLLNGGNYGVVTGINDLIVIDCDDSKLDLFVRENLPKTFSVQSGSRKGNHYYYLVKDLKNNDVTKKGKKLILKDEKGNHLGEIQTLGFQVVGAGSIHPNRNKYSVIDDLDITTLDKDNLFWTFKDFIPSSKIEENIEVFNSLINKKFKIQREIKISDIVSITGQTSHPFHSSTGGMNFKVDDNDLTFRCFRHDFTGNAWHLLAQEEGLISCGDTLKGRNEVWKKLFKIAEKRGYIEKNENLTSKKYLVNEVTDYLLEKNSYITLNDTKEIRFYKNGVYKENGDNQIKSCILKLSFEKGFKFTRHLVAEVTSIVMAGTFIDRSELGKNKTLICVKNGVYDLKKHTLLPHSPDYLFTSKINYDFNKDSKCLKFLNFLSEVLPQNNHLKIQQFFGYCLLKDYPIEKAFILLGDGANGKSKLLEMLIAFLGEENVSTVALQDLSDSDNRFAPAPLEFKLANISMDMSNKPLLDSARVKSLISGELIPMEKKFLSPYNFRNYAKMIVSCNQLPKAEDSDAFYRRLMLVFFPYQFVEEPNKEDKNKKQLIPQVEKGIVDNDEELAGIFNWAIEGLKSLLNDKKFDTTLSINDTRKFYKRLSSPLFTFIDEHAIYSESDFVSKEMFYTQFIKYSESNRLPLWSKERVGREFKDFTKFYSSRRDNVHVWANMKLVFDDMVISGKNNQYSLQ